MTGHPFVELRPLLQEAHKIGVRFQLRGADVVMVGAEALQASLRDALERHRQTGALWSYLGGDENEEGPNALLEELDVTARLVETVPEARAAVRQLIRDLRRHGGFLAVDTETYPEPEFEEPAFAELNATGALSGRPRGKDQTKKPPALDPHRARIQLLQAHAGGRFVFLFRYDALELIACSHWLRRQKVVFHNATFDVGMLRAFRAPRLPTPRQQRGSFHCNMQASGLVLGLGEFEGRNERGLKDVARKLFGLTMPKDLATSCWAAERLTEGQLAYACCDVAITWQAWKVLYPAMQQEGRMGAYRLQRNAIPAVVRMEQAGMPFDPEEHAIQSEKWAREYAEAAHEFKEETGRPPPISQPQIREYLQQILTPAEQDAWPKTAKAGMLKSGEDDLRKLVGRFPSIRSLLVVQAKHTLQKTFGAGLLDYVNPVTGRLHCSFNIAASKAGRFSARQPNLQQLPSNKAPEFRRCISAEDGYALVGCDLSNIEVRAFAWVTQDETLTQIYREKRDLHSEVAASVLGVPLEQAKQMRHLAKAIVFGAITGRPAGE